MIRRKRMKKLYLGILAGLGGILLMGSVCMADPADPAKIEETLLYDENSIKVTATDLKYQYNNPILTVKLENNSDKTLEFTSGAAGFARNAINGYMVGGGFMNEDIAPGTSMNQELKFSSTELSLYGIDDIGQITIDFEVEDEDEDNNAYCQTGPLVIDTSLRDTYDPGEDTYRNTIQDPAALAKIGDVTVKSYAETELYNNAGIAVTSEALLMNNSDSDLGVCLEVENTSDKPVYFGIHDISMKGLQISNGLWDGKDVLPGYKAILSLTRSNLFYHTDPELLGLNDAADLGFKILLWDDDSNTFGEQNLDISLADDFPKVLDAGSIVYENEGTEVYNSNDVRVVFKGISKTQYDDFDVTFVVENHNQHAMRLSMDQENVVVNGSMTIDGSFFSETIDAGCMEPVSVELQADSLSASGLSDPSQISSVKLQYQLQDDSYNDIGIIDIDIPTGEAPSTESTEIN